MKDFMREYGKIAGFTAAGAFFLSLVVGLVSRNPFGAALTRALLLAIAFACLAAAARYLIAKYLPELIASPPPAGEGRPGQTIDITLPEERPASAPRNAQEPEREAAAEELDEPEELGLSSPERAAEESATGAVDVPQAPGRTDGDLLGEEMEDILPPLADMGEETDGLASTEIEGGGDSVEEAESVPEEDVGRDAGLGESAPEADSELGRLPEISSLGSLPRTPPARPGRGMEPPSRPEDELKGTLRGQDPATLARAIRTVLKRDEKG